MNNRILKKIRNFRFMSGLLITLLTMLSFQNCAPPKATDTNSSSTTGKSENASTAVNVWGSRSSSTGMAVGSGSSSSNSSNSSSGYGTGSIGLGGGSGGNSSGGGSSGGGGSTGSGGSDTNSTFRITDQPDSVSVRENESFEIRVGIAGGKSPYKYQWHLNGSPINDGNGVFAIYSNLADTYRKQGTYHVDVTDANGNVVSSSRAQVAFQEATTGCPQGSYFTYTAGGYDAGYHYFDEYFDGPRGKFLINRSYDIYNILYPNPTYTGLWGYNTAAALSHLQKTWMACRHTIPRIHSPAANPAGYGYEDGGGYTYQGSVVFECRNKKLLLVQNTCAWVYNATTPVGGTGVETTPATNGCGGRSCTTSSGRGGK